jgi:Arc/MetJ-type ribon-helix-helix transcriptional regulator
VAAGGVGSGSAGLRPVGRELADRNFRVYYRVPTRVVFTVKLSASLPDEDVAFLDAYRQANGFHSRSAVLHLAIRMLRGAELTSSYEPAWPEWSQTTEAIAWSAVPANVAAPSESST